MLCVIGGCEKPRYQNRLMCGSHFMRAYRYGDPLHTPPLVYNDLRGQRFGSLTPLDYLAKTTASPALWLCLCDCGATSRVRAGDLRRGTTTTCGARLHQLADVVGYGAAHERVYAAKGKASEHACIDCGEPAAQWSYDHADPDELSAINIKGSPTYSLDVGHYAPRCVPCHKVFDLSIAA